MKIIISLCLIISAVYIGRAQVCTDTTIYDTVDVGATYVGGQQAMFMYLASIPYPPEAKENGWMGKVYTRFVVELDGSITNITTLRSSGYEVLDQAVLDHIRKMDNWVPAELNGTPVRSHVVLPMVFRLDNKTIKKAQKKKE